MKIKMKTSIASADWSYGYGQILKVGGEKFTPESLPEETATAWLERDAAELVEEGSEDVEELRAENVALRARIAEFEAERKRETATRQPPETTRVPAPTPGTAAPEPQAPETSTTTDLPEDFPVRDLLIEHGFDSVEKIKAASNEQLLEIDGVGPKRLTEIRAEIG